jgi:hypothetical protein
MDIYTIEEECRFKNVKLLYKSYKFYFNERVIINIKLNKFHNQDKFE